MILIDKVLKLSSWGSWRANVKDLKYVKVVIRGVMGIPEKKTRAREAYNMVGRWGDTVKHNLFCLNWKLRLWDSLARMSMDSLVNIWAYNRMGLVCCQEKAFVWV